MNTRRSLSVAFSAWLLMAGPAAAQTPSAVGDITGTVTAVGGSPLAGVCVSATAYTPDGASHGFGAVTAADGTYTIHSVFAELAFTVRFDAGCSNPTDYVTQWFNDKPDAASADTVSVTTGAVRSGVDAVMRVGGRIRGTVTAGAAPVANVCARLFAGNAGNYDAFRPLQTAPTGADGTYVLRGLAAGTYKVGFADCGTPSNFATQYYAGARTLEAANTITVTGDETVSEIDAAMTPGGRISGEVLIAGTTFGAQGICVGAFDAVTGVPLGGTLAGGSGAYSIGGLPPGSYKVEFFSTGCAFASTAYSTAWYSNADSFAGATTLLVGEGSTLTGISGTVTDTTPPETLGFGAPPAETLERTATFWVYTSEATATVECSLDGAEFAPCGTQPVTLTGLAVGEHTFAARAVDRVGNVDPTPMTWTWRVIADTTPPDTLGFGPEPGATTYRGAWIWPYSDDWQATVECSFDGAPFTACTAPIELSDLADGEHTFAARAVDQAGNVDPTPKTWTWTVDTTGPTTAITSRPGSPTNSTSATFEFTANEAASFECRLDGDYPVPCESGLTYAGLGDGAHAFEVRARDALGNQELAPATFTWTVDTVAPVTSVDSGPTGAIATSAAAFEFTSNESGGSFSCRLDLGDWSTCESPASFSGLAEGEHTFEVAATDGAGNTDATPASRTWTVDTTPPETDITSAPSETVASASVAIEFSSESGATFQCRLDGAGWEGCTSPFTATGLSDGGHSFAVRAADSAGNTDDSPAAASWAVDTTPPDTSITSGPSGATTATSATIAFGSAEQDASFRCRLDGGAWSSCTSPHELSGLADGEHTFEVAARDALGNTDASPASVTWTVDTTPPETTITEGPPKVHHSKSATFSFVADEPGSTFECRLNKKPWAACTSPLLLTELDVAENTLAVRATDPLGNTDATPATHTWTTRGGRG